MLRVPYELNAKQLSIKINKFKKIQGYIYVQISDSLTEIQSKIYC